MHSVATDNYTLYLFREFGGIEGVAGVLYIAVLVGGVINAYHRTTAHNPAPD